MTTLIHSLTRILIGLTLAIACDYFKWPAMPAFFVGWAAAALIYGAILPVKIQ